MKEKYVLIGFIRGGYNGSGHNGGRINREFNSRETCEAAKQVISEIANLDPKDPSEGWLVCVKK